MIRILLFLLVVIPFVSLQMKGAPPIQILLFIISIILLLKWKQWITNKKFIIYETQLTIRSLVQGVNLPITSVEKIEMYTPFMQPDFSTRLFGLRVTDLNGKSVVTGAIFSEEYPMVVDLLKQLKNLNKKIKFDGFLEDFIKNGHPADFIRKYHRPHNTALSVIKGVGVALLIFSIICLMIFSYVIWSTNYSIR